MCSWAAAGPATTMPAIVPASIAKLRLFIVASFCRAWAWSIKSRRRAAIHRDRGALNIARRRGAQEQRKCRNVVGMAEPLQPVLRIGLAAQFLDRSAARGGALLEELLGAFGVG